MSKRKILMLAMTLCMVAILAVGGTLAYFTDEEAVNNVFTMGSVDIELQEDFEQNSALFPGQDVNKDVFVKNIGESDAYVRVHIAIPAKMDDGDPTFAAVNNFLHFNFTNDSTVDGQWSWLPTMTDGTGYAGNGAGNWNFYQATIDGEAYNVYVVTYRTALKPNETTATAALDKVYLDKSVDAKTNADGTVTYSDDKGNTFTMGKNETVEIKVIAEATQTETFTNAFEALDAAFGKPGSYNPWAE